MTSDLRTIQAGLPTTNSRTAIRISITIQRSIY